eukprot:762591-Hanusia_phi.AAC.2
MASNCKRIRRRSSTAAGHLPLVVNARHHPHVACLHERANLPFLLSDEGEQAKGERGDGTSDGRGSGR